MTSSCSAGSHPAHKYRRPATRRKTEEAGTLRLLPRTGKKFLLLARNSFDLILMDVQMPEIDGLTATAKNRETEHTNSHVPVIAMTAPAMKEYEERYLHAGTDGYVSKPISASALDYALKNALQGT